jgi:hypothetical protein
VDRGLGRRRAAPLGLLGQDCVEGIRRLMQSDYGEPVNLGTFWLLSSKELTTHIVVARPPSSVPVPQSSPFFRVDAHQPSTADIWRGGPRDH